MIRKQPSSTTDHIQITFELPSGLWADRIHVVGDFNQWSHTATPMHQGRDGMWRASIEVPTGRQYEFRYLIDGNWHTDYHADGSRPNSFGSENSVLDATLPVVVEMNEAPEHSGVGGQVLRLPPRVTPPGRRVLAPAA